MLLKLDKHTFVSIDPLCSFVTHSIVVSFTEEISQVLPSISTDEDEPRDLKNNFSCKFISIALKLFLKCVYKI